MKRRFLKIAVLLVLGAIVNVAVAWGCGLWSMTEPAVDADVAIPRYDEFRTLAGGTPLRDFQGDACIGRGVRISRLSMTELSWELLTSSYYYPFESHVQLHQTGWPCLSMQSVGKQSRGKMQIRYGVRADWIDVIARSNGATPRLNLIPLWPGFAINTIFYGAILWLLFVAPFALRRWRRIKRGLCPACAYPVGSNELCTECGKPVSTAMPKMLDAG